MRPPDRRKSRLLVTPSLEPIQKHELESDWLCWSQEINRDEGGSMPYMKKNSGCICRLIAFIFFLVICQICIISLSYAGSNMDNQKPLIKQFGSKPGSYDLLIRVSKPILDPGDRVYVDVYVSGYGHIKSACVYIMPSWSIFSIDDSRIAVGDSEAQKWDTLSELVCIDNQSFVDLYTDVSNRSMVLTEVNTRPPGSKAPINLDLKTSPEVSPGIYSINFVLKYYNGEIWNTKSTSVNITVRNFYQRHEILVWIIGGIAAFLSIISTIYPFLKWLWSKLAHFF